MGYPKDNESHCCRSLGMGSLDGCWSASRESRTRADTNEHGYLDRHWTHNTGREHRHGRHYACSGSTYGNSSCHSMIDSGRAKTWTEVFHVPDSCRSISNQCPVILLAFTKTV